jgi:PAP2 superfamily
MTQERLDYAAVELDEISPYRPSARPANPSWRERLRTHRRAWMAVRGAREIVLIGLTYALYDITRYLVAGEHGPAFRHGRALFNLERQLDLDPEHTLNRLFSSHLILGLPADYIYATLHYVVTPVVLIWMWRCHQDAYPRARTVLISMTLVGLMCFALFPVAPPRLLGGFVDTMAHYSHYGWWSTAGSAPRGFGGDTNQFAAMPSLHVGWALWSGWQLIRHGRHRVTRLLGYAYPVVLSVVVIATANHYFLDVVGGIVVMGIGAGIATLWTSFTRRYWPPYVPPTPSTA